VPTSSACWTRPTHQGDSRQPPSSEREWTPSYGAVDECTYRLVVEGELGSRFANAFEGMELKAADGRTEISGRIADPAQLRGLLERIDNLGLTLVSVNPNHTAD
jgi:hypothetical protein